MSILHSIRTNISKPHKAGYPFLCISALISFIGYRIHARIGHLIGLIGSLFFGFCWYFFRNPKRIVPHKNDILVSPADGTVSAINYIPPPVDLGLDDKPVWRISIFLSIFNVHLQRIPVAGKITARSYIKGKFFNASLDKASEHNERNAICITLPDGKKVVVVQIAGLIARRIVCNADINQQFNMGDIYGLIRFGSRVDLYLPDGCQPCVEVGQTMIGGETIVAKL